MHVTLSKNGTMISLDMNVKIQIIGVLAKKVICGILLHVIARVIKLVKLVNI